MNADNLKAWRERLGLTQEALAAALGISKRTVQDWEYGRGNAPAYLELALCELERRLKRKRKA